jgi:hypothetical protein
VAELQQLDHAAHLIDASGNSARQRQRRKAD